MSEDGRSPDEDRIAPELVRAITGIADQLAASDGEADLAARFAWLVDVLIQRGHLAPGHRRMLDRIRDERGVVHLATFRDKRAVRGPEDLDCAALLPLCRARCCALTVSLSAQDVREGTLPWMIHAPYLMPKAADTGYCACMREDGACSVYDDRPGTCRAYDCRHDRRVWIDFERRIPAPLPDDVRPPAAMP